MRIRWSPQAADDLEVAVQYLVERNPDAAARLVDDVFELLDGLAEGRFDGPQQTLRNGERARSWPLPPFRIYYQRSEELVVLRFYHQRREPIST